MCTLTYIPQVDGFILTSNRDEQLNRPLALPPASLKLQNGVSATFAQDPQANGTWLVHADNQFTLCLLNGAFTIHQRKLPYRQSRGLVPLHFLEFYNNVTAFHENYNFEGIEPFTLVFIKHEENPIQNTVHEIRWDGTTAHLKKRNARKAIIWSSCTLYTPETVIQRENWFDTMLQNKQPNYSFSLTKPSYEHIDANDMLHFHQFGGNGDETQNIQMYRNRQARTVSITLIQQQAQKTTYIYTDLIQQKNYQISIHASEKLAV